MPTCPAFSSVGVPGPLAGRESAPSVALYILKTKKERKKMLFRLICSEITFTSTKILHLHVHRWENI